MIISHVTWSGYDRDGFLAVQVESLSEGDHGMSPLHNLQPLGLHARPVDPDGRAGVLTERSLDGKEGFVRLYGDQRTEWQLPNLNKGATCLHDTGTFKGHPFHYTVTLDAEAEQLEIKSWRAGNLITIENVEGLRSEHDGTEFKITGATSAELGGTQPLSVAALVDAQLNALKVAILSAASSEAAAAGLGGTTALAAALGAWPLSTAALITKGA